MTTKFNLEVLEIIYPDGHDGMPVRICKNVETGTIYWVEEYDGLSEDVTVLSEEVLPVLV